MKKLFLLFALFFVTISYADTSLNLTSQEKLYIKQHPVIHFVVDPDWAPFEFVDSKGEYQGIVKNYLDLISKISGLTFKRTKTTSWQESNKLIKNHQSDMYSCVTETPKRKKLMYFSKPYLIFPYVVDLTLSNLAGEIEGSVYSGFGLLVESFNSF